MFALHFIITNFIILFRPNFIYLLDYVTQTENFPIGDWEKDK